MPASLLVACCLTLLGSTPPPSMTEGEAAAVVERIDAAAFFERLVERYRELAAYRDLTSVVRTLHGAPGTTTETQRTEVQVICDVLDGELRIITPGSQLRDMVRDSLRLNVRVHRAGGEERDGEGEETGGGSEVVNEESSSDSSKPRSLDPSRLPQQYRLWLAPHLALKFSDDPLSEMRPAAPDPFTATEAAPVMVEDRVMVHVELTSGRASAGRAVDDDFDAKFDLYVNPDSMLIERIEGRERLPDGGSVETTYTITPIVATTFEAVAPAAAEEEVIAETVESNEGTNGLDVGAGRTDTPDPHHPSDHVEGGFSGGT